MKQLDFKVFKHGDFVTYIGVGFYSEYFEAYYGRITSHDFKRADGTKGDISYKIIGFDGELTYLQRFRINSLTKYLVY